MSIRANGVSWFNGGAERITVLGNGNVGIGTNNPGAHRLRVHGADERALCLARYTPDNVAISLMFEHYPGLPGYQSFVQSQQVGDGKTNLYFFTSTTGGVNHRFTIDYGGNAWLSGYLTQGSDRTLKKNIEPLSYGLQTITNLQPVKYHFNDQTDQEHKHFGLIAQEVQDVIPEIVSTKNDKLALSYTEIVPILINAVKEQQQQILDLNSRLIRLESLLMK